MTTAIPDELYRTLERSLNRHEGKRSHPYDDVTGQRLHPGQVVRGNITIGIGRNLFARGLTEDEIYFLFRNDVRDALSDARAVLGRDIFDGLTVNRQAVLVEMAFNLGRLRLAGFTNTLQAVKEGRYSDAARGMLQSRWAQQVGERASTLARMMEKG